MKSLSQPHHWHIFCRVIDNFGDIGVCWRLAKQLNQQFGQQVNLWVDDLASFKAICPEVDTASAEQQINEIKIWHWQELLPAIGVIALETADVVIEAFGCELPGVALQAMRQQAIQPVWLNLEYLSAEEWVEGMHTLPSPVHGMTKYFFFPGFTDKTGGVLWEPELLALSEKMQRVEARAALFAQLGVAQELASHTVQISLFAYENSQVNALLNTLQYYVEPVHLLVPQGRVSHAVYAWLGQELKLGESFTKDSLTVSALPFMSQSLYDQLLATCQLNFVRGEESFVRAQMLGLPMIWHIYQQQDEVHLDKLSAFLQVYLADCDEASKLFIRQAFLTWNIPSLSNEWAGLLGHLALWQQHAKAWQLRQQAHGSLAENLVKFIQTRYSASHFLNN